MPVSIKMSEKIHTTGFRIQRLEIPRQELVKYRNVLRKRQLEAGQEEKRLECQ